MFSNICLSVWDKIEVGKSYYPYHHSELLLYWGVLEWYMNALLHNLINYPSMSSVHIVLCWSLIQDAVIDLFQDLGSDCLILERGLGEGVWWLAKVDFILYFHRGVWHFAEPGGGMTFFWPQFAIFSILPNIGYFIYSILDTIVLTIIIFLYQLISISNISI